MAGLFTDLVVSRDGTKLALTEFVSSLNLARVPLDSERMEPSGPEEVLNTGQVIDNHPRFSPDGSRIAYESNRLGRREIWILDLESREQDRLELPGENTTPYWSPDGSFLSLMRFHEDGTRSLWLVAVDGRPAKDVGEELSMRPGTVRVAKSRVLQRLRQELGELLE